MARRNGRNGSDGEGRRLAVETAVSEPTSQMRDVANPGMHGVE